MPGFLETTGLRPPAGQAELFATLNAVLEPQVRRGWGSPCLFQPAGLIVLETRGRRSGRRLRVPLAALRVGNTVVVSTVRSRSSQWLRNLAAHPEVRFWMGGKPRAARALVLPAGAAKATGAADGHAGGVAGLGAPVRALVAALTPYRRAGMSFAVLTPA